jgi:hypothetical protein
MRNVLCLAVPTPFSTAAITVSLMPGMPARHRVPYLPATAAPAAIPALSSPVRAV